MSAPDDRRPIDDELDSSEQALADRLATVLVRRAGDLTFADDAFDPTRPATAATWESTNSAASRVSAGEEWMVASATARARHAGTRPAWTCPHNRGSRWRSSKA